MGWWGERMDLTPWCGDATQECTDMAYAQAVAVKRAQVRGVRQRVTVGREFKPGLRLLLVADNPEVAEPPC